GPNRQPEKSNPDDKHSLCRQLNARIRDENSLKGAGWVWGHLLNANLGGKNNGQNLTLLTQGGNGNSANQEHNGVEALVKKAADACDSIERYYSSKEWIPCVEYTVAVILNDQSDDPELYALDKQIPWGIRVSSRPVLIDRDSKRNIQVLKNKNKYREKLREIFRGIQPDTIKNFLASEIAEKGISNGSDYHELHPSSLKAKKNSNSGIPKLSKITKPSKTTPASRTASSRKRIVTHFHPASASGVGGGFGSGSGSGSGGGTGSSSGGSSSIAAATTPPAKKWRFFRK
ncbi:MAG: hypothetical protein KGM99_13320, partial [Burkholderiales bacterium]|nr:hypothetical protein [Burkholderiales bacterium]